MVKSSDVEVSDDNVAEGQEFLCQGKLIYDQQSDAWAAATVARFQHGGVQLKAYQCQICNMWHLASLN